MLLIFWYSQGVIKIVYLKQGHTIYGAYYAGQFVPAAWAVPHIVPCILAAVPAAWAVLRLVPRI